MMTWVQTQKLRRDEASLMTEWQTRWAQSACFNADGVVDYERWSALPDRKHIVVLLKETNGLHGSLVEFLYHGGSKTYYRTWNNVARWANMILNGTYWKFVPKSSLDDMVRNIAVVNLKKCPGGAIASSKAVRQAARQDADLLKCQIQLYEPDIILTGGWGLVSNILHDEIFADDAEWIRPHEETALWCYLNALLCMFGQLFCFTIVRLLVKPFLTLMSSSLPLDSGAAYLQQAFLYLCRPNCFCNTTVQNAKNRPSQPKRLRNRRKGLKPEKEGFFASLYFV